MGEPGPRKTQRNRWRGEIINHLEDFPRQYGALENAMAAFGEDFDLQSFKEAFNAIEDMDAYNRAQVVERAAGRVQNYIAKLAQSGAKLAELKLPPMKSDGSLAQQAFEALRNAKVIDGSQCRQLIQAQKDRSRIEHFYLDIPAGEVHRAARRIHRASREFIASYRAWIEPYITEPTR